MCSRRRRSKGSDCLVLCDTNGGSLPHEVERIVREVVAYVGSDVSVGVHLHDDTGCGVANALAGVRGGATQVQGTINGYGERTGNCNLTTIIPEPHAEDGRAHAARRTPRAAHRCRHHVAELVNLTPHPQQPYVGSSAFAHKAGLHMSAIGQAPGRLRARRPEPRRQRHAGSWCPSWRAGRRWR